MINTVSRASGLVMGQVGSEARTFSSTPGLGVFSRKTIEIRPNVPLSQPSDVARRNPRNARSQ